MLNSHGSPTSVPRRRGTDVETHVERAFEIDRSVAASGLFCAAYMIWAQFGHGSAATNKVVSDVLSAVVAVVCTLWSLWGLARFRTDSDRRGLLPSLLMSLGIGGYAVGACLYGYYDLATHQTPFPSWADAGYLIGTLGTISAVLFLPSQPIPAVMRVRILLDSLMVMAALVTLSWFLALGPTILDGEASLFAKILGGAYPLADLSMLFCVLVLASHAQEPGFRRIRGMVVAGLLGYVVSDTVYCYQTLHETYQAGGPADVGWILANLMFAQAARALRQRKGRLAELTEEASKAAVWTRPTSLWRFALPYALVPVVVALVLYVHATPVVKGLSMGVYVGAATLLVLVVVRQVFAIAENTRLYRFLQEAYQELEALATTDSMTGLANHRVFQQRLREEIALSGIAGEPTCLLLIDVDRFKAYNDRFGHPAGDEALRIVARILQENLRDTDLAARYGGEEFAVILPGTRVNAAFEVSERLRTTCEASTFPHREVTLSIGVAEVAGRDAGSLIEAADNALYAAKHAGRNRVVREGTHLEHAEDQDLALERVLPEGWSVQESATRLGAPSASNEERSSAESLASALWAMLDLRDGNGNRHSDRVTHYAVRLAEQVNRMGTIRLSDDEIEGLRLGAMLRDIGMVGVPDAILDKPAELTPDEWAIVRRHPAEGAALLERFPELARAVPLVRSHHESWDGAGYPQGLAGDAIPLGARLLALADTFDAMSHERPYRRAMPYSVVRAEIVRMSGRQFEPALVEAFLAISEEDWKRLPPNESSPKAA